MKINNNLIIKIAFWDDILSVVLTTMIMLLIRSHETTNSWLLFISKYEGFIFAYAIELLVFIIVTTAYMIDKYKINQHLL